MANFLLDLAAGLKGMQDYEKLQAEQEATKLELEQRKVKLAELKDLAAEAKKARARQPKEAELTLGFLGGGRGPMGIMPPPGVMPPPEPPPVQAPMPGVQSQPMMQPRAFDPPEDGMPMPPQGIPMPPQGAPMAPPAPSVPIGPMDDMGGAPMPPQGPQTPPQGAPAIPPYQTVGGASPMPMGAPTGIPPPPVSGPRPNSMTMADAVGFIQSQGIDDPRVGVNVLNNLMPFLNNEAKQQAKMLELQQENALKMAQLEEKKRAADQRSEDYRLSIDQRKEAAKEANAIRKDLGQMRIAITKQNADTRAKQAGGGSSAPAKPGEIDRADDIEVQAWKFLTKGENPPAKSPDYKPIMQRVALIAKENGLSPQEIISASADVKTKLAAKKNFEVRAQNMERAENQILSEIPLIRDSIKQINLPSIPIFAKGGMAALRQLGDPRITALDQAVETVFNEFEGIRTGNPGTLNVSDVQNAKHAYENAKTPQQMEAAIKGIERTIANAKGAMAKTRSHIMDDINAGFKKEGLGGHAKEEAKPSAAPKAGGVTRIKDAAEYNALPSGTVFIDPAGVTRRKP